MRLAQVIAFIFLGCTTARLYPVDGPYTKSGVSQPLAAKISGILGNNGSLNILLPDGSECVGEWSSAASSNVQYSSVSLIGRYGQALLSGYSIDAGTGQNPGRAIALCPDGTRFDIEFITGAGTASGFGIAKDTKGNLYRVLF